MRTGLVQAGAITRRLYECRQNNPKVPLESRRMGQFPSMKAKRLLATLERRPLGYRVARQTGSHRRLEAPGRPPLTFAFHDNATIPSRLVRKILVRDVGLAENEAQKLL
jgi:predicted RNA binding protein YcfA (HicA-like mRNA interferase family)